MAIATCNWASRTSRSNRWSRSLRSGDEAAVVVRPEDVVLAEHRDAAHGADRRRRESGRAAVRRRDRAAEDRGRGEPDARERTAPGRTDAVDRSVAHGAGCRALAAHRRPASIRRLQADAHAADADQQPARRRRRRANRAAARGHADRARALRAHAHRSAVVRRGGRTSRGGARPARRRTGSRRGFVGGLSVCSSAVRARCSRSATAEHRSSGC